MAGFTMAEMLLVIGIILMIFTTFAIATRPNPGKAVRLGQAQVAGLFAIAPLQAKATQGNGRKTSTDSDAARIIIYASKEDLKEDLPRYLRQLQVVVPDPADPNKNWITVSEIVVLPAGVFVVPPSIPTPTMPGTLWPSGTGRISQFVSMGNKASGASSTASATTREPMMVDGQTKNYFFIRYTARATLSGTGDRLVLTEGRRPADDTDTEPMRFTNAQNIRGFRVSQYGAVTFLNNAQDFPP